MYLRRIQAMYRVLWANMDITTDKLLKLPPFNLIDEADRLAFMQLAKDLDIILEDFLLGKVYKKDCKLNPWPYTERQLLAIAADLSSIYYKTFSGRSQNAYEKEYTLICGTSLEDKSFVLGSKLVDSSKVYLDPYRQSLQFMGCYKALAEDNNELAYEMYRDAANYICNLLMVWAVYKNFDNIIYSNSDTDLTFTKRLLPALKKLGYTIRVNILLASNESLDEPDIISSEFASIKHALLPLIDTAAFYWVAGKYRPHLTAEQSDARLHKFAYFNRAQDAKNVIGSANNLVMLDSAEGSFVKANISAVIFDCDGVLVETLNDSFLSYQQALAKHNVIFTLEEYVPLTGQITEEKMASIVRMKNLSLDPVALITERNIILEELRSKGVEPIVDAVRLLQQLIANKKKYNIKIGLASSAPRKHIIQNLEQIKIKVKDFDDIVSGTDDLKHITDPEGTNKPKPYIYNLIAKNLKVDPIECVAIEDSRAGVFAAFLAGMTPIAVPNKFTKKHDFAGSSLVVESLGSIKFKKLNILDDLCPYVVQEPPPKPAFNFINYLPAFALGFGAAAAAVGAACLLSGRAGSFKIKPGG